MSTVQPNLRDTRSKTTVRTFQRKKTQRKKSQSKEDKKQILSMVTAYDYSAAVLVEQAGFDSILVGDSLGMVVLGYENTLPVTMEDMLHHCKAVARGARSPLLIGDMPFMSYQVSVSEAVRNAGRFLQEAGMEAVKLEGGRERADAVRAIANAGIPVMGHIGLTPQSVHQLGGFRGQGKTAMAARRLFEDAMILQDAGCFGLVLESVPTQLAKLITERLDIPTIGIGAGNQCDGQVLVYHDLLGLFDRFTPKFVKKFADLHGDVVKALTAFKAEVEDQSFPQEVHSTSLSDRIWNQVLQDLDESPDANSGADPDANSDANLHAVSGL